MSEKTFIALKPDSVQRGLIGDLIGRFEQKGLRLLGLKLMKVSRAKAEEHYAEHVGKAFFEGLVDFITSAPIVAMVWEGPDAVSTCRKLIGKTSPVDAEPGTIRFDYGIVMHRNLVHGSDSPESAEREIGIFFKPEELVTWEKTLSSWIGY